MKKTLLTALTLSSFTIFATPLEEPSISAEIKFYKSNKVKVTREYEEIYESEKKECDEMRVYKFGRQNRRKVKDDCRKEARRRRDQNIKDNIVETLIESINTENENDKPSFIALMREDKHARIYEVMKELREIAKSDDTKKRVQKLKELTGATKITFELRVSLYEQEKYELWYRKFTRIGKVYLLADNKGPRWFYNLYPSSDEELGAFRQQSLAKEVELALERRINEVEEKQLKENGLEEIIDDFSSLEESDENKSETRFI